VNYVSNNGVPENHVATYRARNLQYGNGTWVSVSQDRLYIYQEVAGALVRRYDGTVRPTRFSKIFEFDGKLYMAAGFTSAPYFFVYRYVYNPVLDRENFDELISEINVITSPSATAFIDDGANRIILIGCCTSTKGNSLIYQYNNVTDAFDQIGTFNTGKAVAHMEVIAVAGVQYVVVSNGRVDVNDPVVVYRWTGTGLVVESELPVLGANQVVPFALNGEVHILISSRVDPLGRTSTRSPVYRFLGAAPSVAPPLVGEDSIPADSPIGWTAWTSSVYGQQSRVYMAALYGTTIRVYRLETGIPAQTKPVKQPLPALPMDNTFAAAPTKLRFSATTTVGSALTPVTRVSQGTSTPSVAAIVPSNSSQAIIFYGVAYSIGRSFNGTTFSPTAYPRPSFTYDSQSSARLFTYSLRSNSVPEGDFLIYPAISAGSILKVDQNGVISVNDNALSSMSVAKIGRWSDDTFFVAVLSRSGDAVNIYQYRLNTIFGRTEFTDYVQTINYASGSDLAWINANGNLYLVVACCSTADPRGWSLFTRYDPSERKFVNIYEKYTLGITRMETMEYHGKTFVATYAGASDPATTPVNDPPRVYYWHAINETLVEVATLREMFHSTLIFMPQDIEFFVEDDTLYLIVVNRGPVVSSIGGVSYSNAGYAPTFFYRMDPATFEFVLVDEFWHSFVVDYTSFRLNNKRYFTVASYKLPDQVWQLEAHQWNSNASTSTTTSPWAVSSAPVPPNSQEWEMTSWFYFGSSPPTNIMSFEPRNDPGRPRFVVNIQGSGQTLYTYDGARYTAVRGGANLCPSCDDSGNNKVLFFYIDCDVGLYDMVLLIAASRPSSAIYIDGETNDQAYFVPSDLPLRRAGDGIHVDSSY
jgi:hypothetical protein